MSYHSSPWKTPLILASLLFVISSTAYWFEFRQKPEADRARNSAKKLFDLAHGNSVTRIELFTPGQSAVALSCLDQGQGLCKAGDSSRWEMSAPAKLKADDSNVHSLISSLNNLVPTETISLSDEPPEQRPALLRQYGLESSQRAEVPSVSVTGADSQRRTLFLGSKHPVGDSRFAMLFENTEPEKVFLISGDFGSVISRPLTHWREKRFVPLVAADVKRIQLMQDGVTLKATREKDGWSLESRLASKIAQTPGDPENVGSWLSSIVFLSAEGFLAEKKSSREGQLSLAGSKTVLQLELEDQAGKKFTLELREKKEKSSWRLIAISPSLDPVFALDAGARNRLSKKLSDLQLSKLLSSLDRFNARSLRIQSKDYPSGSISLKSESDGSKWRREDSGAELSPAVVTGLLEKLSGNKILRFFTLKPHEQDPSKNSRLTVELLDGSNQTLQKLTFWRAGQKLFAQDLKNSSDRAFELEPSLESALPWTPSFFNQAGAQP